MNAGERIDAGRLELDEDGLVTAGGRPFTGVAVASDRATGERTETGFVDGVRQGPSRTWDRAGRLRASADWWQGALHGTSRAFNADGTLEAEEDYEFGVLVRRRESAGGRLAETWAITPADDLYRILELSRARWPDAPTP